MSTTKERPILFSGAMVRALLAGTKTQTRRVVKPQPDTAHDSEPYWFIGGYRVWGYRPAPAVPLREGGNPLPCPYGQPGDRLWVRETWRGIVKTSAPWDDCTTYGVAHYVPDEDECRRLEYAATFGEGAKGWRPSIHMPRWASRITLEITRARVERLQDISKADAMAEGIVLQPDGGYGLADTTHYHSTDPRQSYFSLWEAINGDGSVQANPWVWVVEFRRLP